MAQSDNDILVMIGLGLGAFLLIKSRSAVAAPLSQAQVTQSIMTPQNPRVGSDASVAFYQGALNQLVGAGLTVDGIMGSATRQAVMKFQQIWGITVDGIIGPETDYDIRAALGQQGYTDQPYNPTSPTWYDSGAYTVY